MVRRLNVVAQRASRRNHRDGFSFGAGGDSTPDASTATNRHSGNPLFDADTLSGGRPEIDGISRPGWRRNSTEQHQEYHPVHDVHGAETAAFSTGHGER